MAHLTPVMQQNFIEYASYTIVERAFPDIRDGCKPVQRRILQTMFEADDGRFHKVANIVGETMKLHPHGDASIYEALVVLANKEYFIERQGNFGNIITGHRPAAPRYIEARLTPLARETLFNKHLTDIQPSYDGRKREFVFLPAKVPVALMLGTDGIGVGMSTRILPHNFRELLDAQIRLLRNEPIELFPDFLQGGIMDVADYQDGRGRVRLRARIERRGDKKVVITEIPYGTTTESLIESIENQAQRGKVKIAGINDFTTDRVEIEVALPRGVYADEVIPQLYAYTDCEIQCNSNITVIRDGRPAELTVTEILYDLTLQLRDLIKRELEWELDRLGDQHHWLTLEQIFIENRVYKQIEDKTSAAAVRQAVHDGMQPFAHLFVRAMLDDDVDRLLEIRIRRISQFDIDKNRRDIDDIVRAIEECGRRLRRLTKTTIAYLEDLAGRYADAYPRRTEIGIFEQVDVKAVARANLKLSYDRDSGFFGTEVRGKDFQFSLSEYDKVLIVSKDGSYRIMSPPDKFLVPGRAVHIQPFDPERGASFVVVYRDKKKIAYGKRIRIDKFINGREYELIKGRDGTLDLLLPGDADGTIHCTFCKAPRQRVTECDFDLAQLAVTSAGARGTRMAPKPVARFKQL